MTYVQTTAAYQALAEPVECLFARIVRAAKVPARAQRPTDLLATSSMRAQC